MWFLLAGRLLFCGGHIEFDGVLFIHQTLFVCTTLWPGLTHSVCLLICVGPD